MGSLEVILPMSAILPEDGVGHHGVPPLRSWGVWFEDENGVTRRQYTVLADSDLSAAEEGTALLISDASVSGVDMVGWNIYVEEMM